MKSIVWAGLALQLCSVAAFAQQMAPAPASPLPSTSGGTSSGGGTAGGFAAITPTPGTAQTVNENGLARGANSFTEDQARSRLQFNGYNQVSALTKGNDGIWRGSATKNGSPVHVAIDFKGNISMK